MVAAMVLGGLRRCEVLGLRMEDLRVGEHRVFIANGKGGHQRLALRAFVGFLVETAPEVLSVAQITRAHIEDYKPWLAPLPMASMRLPPPNCCEPPRTRLALRILNPAGTRFLCFVKAVGRPSLPRSARRALPLARSSSRQTIRAPALG